MNSSRSRFLPKKNENIHLYKDLKRMFIVGFIHKSKNWGVWGEPSIAYSPIHQQGNEFDKLSHIYLIG